MGEPAAIQPVAVTLAEMGMRRTRHSDVIKLDNVFDDEYYVISLFYPKISLFTPCQFIFCINVAHFSEVHAPGEIATEIDKRWLSVTCGKDY
jgi:hypothetical protein